MHAGDHTRIFTEMPSAYIRRLPQLRRLVSVSIGDEEFFFDGELIDADGLLEVGASAEVGLVVTASVDAAGVIEVTLIVTDCAGEPEPTATPTPTTPATPGPTTGPTTAPTDDNGGPGVGTATATPATLLPDTSVTTAVGGGWLAAALLVLLSVGSLSSWSSIDLAGAETGGCNPLVRGPP